MVAIVELNRTTSGLKPAGLHAPLNCEKIRRHVLDCLGTLCTEAAKGFNSKSQCDFAKERILFSAILEISRSILSRMDNYGCKWSSTASCSGAERLLLDCFPGFGKTVLQLEADNSDWMSLYWAGLTKGTKTSDVHLILQGALQSQPHIQTSKSLDSCLHP
jgi:hypothetical protein